MLGYTRQCPDGNAVVSAQHEREAALLDDIDMPPLSSSSFGITWLYSLILKEAKGRQQLRQGCFWRLENPFIVESRLIPWFFCQICRRAFIHLIADPLTLIIDNENTRCFGI